MTDDAKTVLVVDDDPDAREYLSTVLQDNGFTATTANDGVQAIASLEQQIPDLVTLDIAMPEKSGVRLYTELRKDDGLKSIPVIVVTGIQGEIELAHMPPAAP